MIYDVIVIGAGAAGLMAAIAASQNRKSVLVLEANERPGKKILISGGGRCNFTNLNVSADDYVSENPHFCKSALKQFTQNDFIALVKAAKILYYEKTLGQLFCQHSSKQILQMLLEKLKHKQTQVLCKQKVINIKQNKIFIVQTETETFSCKNLIIASGGLSFPQLGVSPIGYNIAKQFGHDITELSPALDGFVLAGEQKSLCRLAGLSHKVILKVGKKEFYENILFTHKGISGPAALKGSLYWQKSKPVHLDFLPEHQNLIETFESLKQKSPTTKVVRWLSQHMPQNLVDHFATTFDFKNLNFADLAKTKTKTLNDNLKHFSFVPAKTVGYEKAEVTRGGISTKDLDSKTMESKKQKGLYFVGEVVDVTGLLGGYNFQWAWSSGWVAGKNIS